MYAFPREHRRGARRARDAQRALHYYYCYYYYYYCYCYGYCYC